MVTLTLRVILSLSAILGLYACGQQGPLVPTPSPADSNEETPVIEHAEPAVEVRQ